MEKTHLLTILVSIIIGLSVLNLIFTMIVDTKLTGLIGTGNAVGGNNLPTGTGNNPTPTKVDAKPGDGAVLGKSNAPVTII